MPDIALLTPTVLRGVIQKFPTPDTLILLSRIPRTPWPYPTAMWDVVRGSRAIATPNVPNSEAHIIPKLGISQESAALVYLREKKVFEPTTIHWLRTPGTLAERNAEAAVLREVGELDIRFNNFAEWMCWQMLQGMLTLDFDDVQAVIDYKIPLTHKINAGTTWATATIQQMVDDIFAVKQLGSRDGQVTINEAFASPKTISRIFKAAAAAGSDVLSDRQKDNYLNGGQLLGFQGITWNPVDTFYEDSTGTPVPFLAEDKVIFANLSANNPVEILEGPTADDEAPSNFTGKFSKTWKEKDPSARQFLLEWHLLPILTRPEQIVVLDVIP